MATVVSTLFISLDGVVEIDPAWHFPYFDDNMGAAVAEDYAGANALLIGRVTYDSFAGAWPGREDAGGPDATFAVQLGDVRKIVASRQDLDLGWRNAELLQGELPEAVAALRSDPSIQKILIPGSISIVRQLLEVELLDELRLLVHPVAARHGERLFTEADSPLPLRLLRSESFPTGVLRLIYGIGEPLAATTYEDVVDDLPGAGDS